MNRKLLARFSLSILLVGTGCVAPPPSLAPGATQADRLMRVYPELRGGRFAVIADFEDAKQIDLFRLEEGSESGKLALDPKGGRAETGRACLSMTTASSEETLVVGNTDEARWYLKRDWRAYDLLMLSVFAPGDSASLELTLSSGPIDRKMSATTVVPLDKGWNVSRLDLADVAELVALDDVREMRWTIRGPKKSAFRFDDILLTSNREDVFGDSRNGIGLLYAQRAGKRWNIGAGGSFEIAFAHGQIVSWFNLAEDPNRVRNLVQGTTLGPSPVVVNADGSEAGDFSVLGASVAASQVLLEANRVRAVLACEWRFVGDAKQSAAEGPFQRWVYTIYPTGQIHVTVQATARTQSWTPPGLGLAASVANPGGDDWIVDIESGATARSDAAGVWLAYAVHRTSSLSPMVQVRDDSKKRLSLIALGRHDVDEIEWSACLHLGHKLPAADIEAQRRLQEYMSPTSARLELGSAQTNKSGNSREVTPDPADGAYKINLEKGHARWTLDGRKQALFSPIFEIHGTGKGACWVYVDHRILDNTARTRQGDLLFQIPGIVDRLAAVEVLCGD